MRVRRVEPHEAPRLRELRLRALESDPRAFGATWAEEAALAPEAWRTRASAGDEAPWMIAEDGDAWLGLVAGRVNDDGAHELIAMWTAPEARGRGAGRALVQACLAWARRRGATSVHLWVIDENEPARRLYASCGFIPSGKAVQGRRDPSRNFQRMDRAL